MKGKTLKERARALIMIAHPDVREELCEAYEKRFNEPVRKIQMHMPSAPSKTKKAEPKKTEAPAKAAEAKK